MELNYLLVLNLE